jgi:hypothetical protein
VVLAPSERAVVDVLVDQTGELALEHHTPDRGYRLATFTVGEKQAATPAVRAFEQLGRAPELAAEREQLAAWLAAPPDKVLALVAQMDDPAAMPADAGPVTSPSSGGWRTAASRSAPPMPPTGPGRWWWPPARSRSPSSHRPPRAWPPR